MLQVEDGHDAHDIDTAYEACALRFEILARDIRLMFLESKLYRKYFVQATRTEEKLSGLTAVLGVMATHKQNTLNVLKKVLERESIMRKVRELAGEFHNGRIATLEVQTKVLQLLWMHQHVTLAVVESVGIWRAMLTRPYPFNWNGTNYFLKVLEDCTFIDTCQLNNVLPLHLMQFPMCSNVTSLSLFSPTPPPKAGGPKKSGGHNTTELQSRLVRAEKILFDEDPLQKSLMRELVALSAKGYFVTVLNVQSVIPECATGVHVTNREWDGKLQQALGSIFESYMGGQGGKDPTTATKAPPVREPPPPRPESRAAEGPMVPPPVSATSPGSVSPSSYKDDDFEGEDD